MPQREEYTARWTPVALAARRIHSRHVRQRSWRLPTEGQSINRRRLNLSLSPRSRSLDLSTSSPSLPTSILLPLNHEDSLANCYPPPTPPAGSWLFRPPSTLTPPPPLHHYHQAPSHSYTATSSPTPRARSTFCALHLAASSLSALSPHCRFARIRLPAAAPSLVSLHDHLVSCALELVSRPRSVCSVQINQNRYAALLPLHSKLLTPPATSRPSDAGRPLVSSLRIRL